MQIYGNTTGLSPSERKALERIYRRRVPLDRLSTPELTRALAEVSHSSRRQIGALVHRSGQVEYVVVGDSAKLMLPDIGRSRAGSGRFRGLRLIHTHLRMEPLSRDDLVDLTRLRLDLVAAICLSTDGNPQSVHYAHCVPVPEGQDDEGFRNYGPIPYGKLDLDPSKLLGALEDEFARAARTRKSTAKDGRAILVHVCKKNEAVVAGDSIRELEELARTAGVEVADTVLQVRDRPDPKLVLGRGRLEDTVLRAMQLDVEVLIFDRNLTPAQAAAISRMTDLKVIDRTQLILDIFAQHAQSLDGKLQVELAQTRYLLPRLGTRDDSLSRLTGGIGGRGPGETKLEVGKRRARERIAHLESRLKRFAKQREQRRARRGRHGVQVVAIVGYTNAGKSTLLNALTGSDVIAENKLFATLDPRSRQLRLPGDNGHVREAVLTDTVGFIRDLPKDLFAAFRATFEEASDADLLLQVVDAADPIFEDHLETTQQLLVALGLDRIPRVLVLNKCDLLGAEEAENLERAHGGIATSARDEGSVARLRAVIGERITAAEQERARAQADADAERAELASLTWRQA
ncbi:MAG: GTPase HflX [Myxococcales bacterium]|nr:GTPase HflX [Myxococcales bacterium]